MRLAGTATIALMTLALTGAGPVASAAVDKPGLPVSGIQQESSTKVAPIERCSGSVAIVDRKTRRMSLAAMKPGPVELKPYWMAATETLPVPSPITAMSAVMEEKGMWAISLDFTVVADDARAVVGRTYQMEPEEHLPWRVYRRGTGWGTMTALVEIPMSPPERAVKGLYALNRRGAVYRFGYGQWRTALNRRVRVAGLPALKSLTLRWASDQRDFLLATTSKGALVLVLVEGPQRDRARVVSLRTRGWESFDQIVDAGCGRLLAVQSNRNRAAVYSVGSLRGGRTRVSFVGWSHGTWGNWVVAPHQRSGDVGAWG